MVGGAEKEGLLAGRVRISSIFKRGPVRIAEAPVEGNPVWRRGRRDRRPLLPGVRAAQAGPRVKV